MLVSWLLNLGFGAGCAWISGVAYGAGMPGWLVALNLVGCLLNMAAVVRKMRRAWNAAGFRENW